LGIGAKRGEQPVLVAQISDHDLPLVREPMLRMEKEIVSFVEQVAAFEAVVDG
jgi:hypothetical protein